MGGCWDIGVSKTPFTLKVLKGTFKGDYWGGFKTIEEVDEWIVRQRPTFGEILKPQTMGIYRGQKLIARR
jgi:hypothetical protein